MFRKKKKQPEIQRQRRTLPVEQNKMYSYRASRQSEVLARERLRPEAIADNGDFGRPKRPSPISLIAKRLPALLIVIAVMVLCGLNLIVSSSPKVILVGDATERALLQPASVYEAAIQSQLRTRIWSKFKPTLDTATIDSVLKAKFPEIQSAQTIIPVVGGTITTKITPVQPALILANTSGSFVINNLGRAIAPGTNQSSDSALLVRDESGVPIKVGDQALPLSNIQFLAEVQRQLAAKDIKITEVVLPAGSQSALVHISGKPYIVKFSFQGNATRQAGAFLAAYDHMNQTNTNPSEYVDVRVGEKVYLR